MDEVRAAELARNQQLLTVDDAASHVAAVRDDDLRNLAAAIHADLVALVRALERWT